MAHIIGFAGTFYTLWDFSNETVYCTDSYGKHWPVREKTNYNYIKNISMDLDSAMAAYPGVTVDEGLKGKHTSFSVQNKQEDLCPNIMKFGKYNGRDLNELISEDFQYVLWLVDNSGYSANGKYAKQLPEVVKHMEGIEQAATDLINNNNETFANLIKAGTITFEAEKNLKIHEKFAYMTVPVGNVYATFIFNDFSAQEYNGKAYALPVINGKAKRIKGKSITLTFTEDTNSEYSVFQAIVNSITINK